MICKHGTIENINLENIFWTTNDLVRKAGQVGIMNISKLYNFTYQGRNDLLAKKYLTHVVFVLITFAPTNNVKQQQFQVRRVKILI